MMTETTGRVKLVAVTEELAGAELKDKEKFGKLLGALIPDTWPPDNLKDVRGYFLGLSREHHDWESWLTWYAVRTGIG